MSDENSRIVRRPWHWQQMLLLELAVAAVVMLWVSYDRGKPDFANQAEALAKDGKESSKSEKMSGGEDDALANNNHPPQTSYAWASRQPLQFRSNPVEPAAVLAVLTSGIQTINERVRLLQGMRGISLSQEERDRAMEFLAGKDWPEGMSKGSAHWLADELLTVLRLQEPPWEELAAALGEVAFLAETDPVIRDYIMQHLGHLWEQGGARQEIEKALWRAVGTTDETTPGSALIALSRGYERDQREEKLRDVRQRAFELAKNPETGLAVRVTALAIAGDGGGREVQELAENLVKNPDTPVILRKVAERIGEKDS